MNAALTLIIDDANATPVDDRWDVTAAARPAADLSGHHQPGELDEVHGDGADVGRWITIPGKLLPTLPEEFVTARSEQARAKLAVRQGFEFSERPFIN